MKKPSEILLVDDDENDLLMIVAALTRSGAPAVSMAHDGAEAIDYFHARGRFKARAPGNPGLMLLDLHMPRVDGWEVLRHTKSNPQFRLTPVVVFSSSARESDIHHSYELGANAYVVKPIDYVLFQRAIQQIEAFWLDCNQVTGGGPGKMTSLLPPRRPRPGLKTKTA
ncbi:MAG: response regulator receiver protein [Lacunisphaera sp.]|nr:response regulator receiver protein [Lacunisphaera sp.]MDB6166875.1 response regulator receiver protein [Lacunisphaera sp.]